VFLGTPHHGAGLAHWAESLANAIGVLKQTNAEILAVLKSDSEVLERIQGNFHTMIRARNQNGLAPIEITCFYEQLPLPGVGTVSQTDTRQTLNHSLLSATGCPNAFSHFAWLYSDRNTTKPHGHDEISST
jgi:hypothetical protein